MDQNLTGVIAANVTLIQPWYSGAISLILAAFFGAIIAGGANYFRDLYKNRVFVTRQKQEAYGQLMGRKHMLLELYTAYYTALLRAMYSEYGSIIEAYYNKLSGMEQTVVEDRLKQSINFTISREESERTEDTRNQLTKGIERFWTAISRIQISFSHMSDLDNKISMIEESWKALDRYELQSKGFDTKLVQNVHNLRKRCNSIFLMESCLSGFLLKLFKNGV